MLPINEVYHGDCLELMKELDDNSIDMILCDLPYGTTRNKWDAVIPFEPLWKQYKRITKPNSGIVLTATQPFTSALVLSHVKGYKHQWVWLKNVHGNFAVAKYMPLTLTEDVLVFTTKGERVNYYPIMVPGEAQVSNNSKNTGRGFNLSLKEDWRKVRTERYPKNLLQFNTVVRNHSLHASQKPVALFEYLIKTYTNEGDLVLDNCAGSGTTGVACKNTNRNFILMEKELRYYKISKNRVR